MIIPKLVEKKDSYKPEDETIDEPIINVENTEEQFSKCMNTRSENFEEIFTDEIEELVKEFGKYSVSIVYHNLLDDYKISYNENKVYYSASTVKLAVALYYYEMAAQGLIDLNKELLFKSKYYEESVTKRISLNKMISLKELLSFSIGYSDNGAHWLLIDNIGYTALNTFIAEKMVLQNTFFPNDVYGRINGIDGDVLINTINTFIEENGELGQELKNVMVNKHMNALSIRDLIIGHKYGWWKDDYHELGIIYDKNPYTMAIFTKHGENNAQFTVIRHLHDKIYEFHLIYNESKEAFCRSNIIFP